MEGIFPNFPGKSVCGSSHHLFVLMRGSRTALALFVAGMSLVPAGGVSPEIQAFAYSTLPYFANLVPKTCSRLRPHKLDVAWRNRRASLYTSRTHSLKAIAESVGTQEWEDMQRSRALVSTEWLAQNLEDVTLLDVRGTPIGTTVRLASPSR